jgi:hypothetical protein
MPYEINTGAVYTTTIQELSTVLSIHLAKKMLRLDTGMACTSGKSLLRYNFDSDVMMLLKIKSEKNVNNAMDRSLYANRSPSSSILLKYPRTRSDTTNMPPQKKVPINPNNSSLNGQPPSLVFDKQRFINDQTLGFNNVTMSFILPSA